MEEDDLIFDDDDVMFEAEEAMESQQQQPRTFGESEETIKRKFAYSMADERVEDIITSFVDSSTFAARGWNRTEIRERRSEIAQFLLEYFSTEGANADRLPRSWSVSQVLPVVNMATVGDAGTGKTVSMLNFHSKHPEMTLTGSTGKASDAYIKQLNEIGQTHAFEYLFKHNTWFKTLNLQFHLAKMRAEFNEVIPNNEPLQDSYKNIINNVDACNDPKEVERMFREHTSISLRALFRVINAILEMRKHEFLTYGYYVYRLNVFDPTSQYYQSLEDTFPWVSKLVRIHEDRVRCWEQKTSSTSRDRKTGSNKADTESVIAISRRNKMAASVRSQAGYRRYVMANRVDNPFAKLNLPPLSALNLITLAEEDGRSQGCMKILHDIDSMIVGMIYNTPQSHERPRVYFSSGSDTQSNVIGSAASPLQLIMSPGSISDVANTRVIKSELFRRGLEEYGNPGSELHRTLCLPLERGLNLSENTVSTLYFKEEFPRLFSDPGFQTLGSRLYFRHEEVRNYTNQVSKLHNSNIDIFDVLWVTSNMVLLNHRDLEYGTDPDNIYGVSLEGLSELTEAQAEINRTKAFMRKSNVYVTAVDETHEISISDREERKSPFAFTCEKYDGDEDQEITKKMHALALEKAANAKESARTETKYSDFTRENILYKEYVGKAGTKVKQKRSKGKKKDGETETAHTDRVSAIYIKGPARLLLSREEHIKHRIYTKYIEKEFGNGTQISKQYIQSSKAVDQTAPFCYCPENDMTTVIANPAYEERRHFAAFRNSVRDTIVSVETHLAFKRKRTFTCGGAVVTADNSVSVVIRGVEGTLYKILQDHSFNQHCSLEFKVIVYVALLDAFRRELLVQKGVTVAGYVWGLSFRRVTELWDNVFTTTPEFLETEDGKLIHDIGVFVSALMEPALVAKKRKAPEDSEVPQEKPVCKEITLKSRGGTCVRPKSFPEHGLCAFFLCWLGDVARRHPKFAEERELRIYTENSPLVQNYRWTAKKPMHLKTLAAVDAGDIVVVGNWEHPCMAKERERMLKFKLDKIKASPAHYTETMGENSVHRDWKWKGDAEMMGWSMNTCFPELIYSTVATLSIRGTLIATTVPRVKNDVKWSFVMTDEYRDRGMAPRPPRFGLMLRRHQAGVSGQPDEELYHRRFVLPAMENVAFPRPFIAGDGDPGKVSGIYAKTNSTIRHHASNPRLTFDENGKVCRMSDHELTVQGKEDLLCKRVEASAMISVFCDVLTDYSSTIHYEQGNTKSGKCYVDLGMLKSINKGGGNSFSIDDFMSLILVAVTRANRSENISVADVTSMTRVITLANNDRERRTGALRAARVLMTGYEIFR